MVPSTHGGAEQYAQAVKARRHCEFGLAVARITLLGLLVLWTTAQWGLGLYIRRYAVRLDIQDRAARGQFSSMDAEKGQVYAEDGKMSLADEHDDHVEAVQPWPRDDKSKSEKQWSAETRVEKGDTC